MWAEGGRPLRTRTPGALYRAHVPCVGGPNVGRVAALSALHSVLAALCREIDCMQLFSKKGGQREVRLLICEFFSISLQPACQKMVSRWGSMRVLISA